MKLHLFKIVGGEVRAVSHMALRDNEGGEMAEVSVGWSSVYSSSYLDLY